MEAALDDPAPSNPLARDAAAEVANYAQYLASQISDRGTTPDPLILPRPRSQLEANAMDVFLRDIASLNLRIVLSEPVAAGA